VTTSLELAEQVMYLFAAAVAAWCVTHRSTRFISALLIVASAGYRLHEEPALATIVSLGVVALTFVAAVLIIGGKVSSRTFYPTIVIFAVLPVSLWVYPLAAYGAMLIRAVWVAIRTRGAAYTALVVHDSVEALGFSSTTLAPVRAPDSNRIPTSTELKPIKPLLYLEVLLIAGIVLSFVRYLT
jgi:hypothetical protein